MGANRMERIGDAELWLGDCLDILPTLPRVDAVITDPPYGMRAFGITKGASANSRWDLKGGGDWAAAWPEWDGEAPPIVGTFPEIAGQVIVWGGQFFPLPMARGWLVWNKIIRNWSSSECELAWTNIEQPVRAFDYSHGQLANEGKQHPTQKPLPLMKWCVEKTTGAVLDPFMGSGTTGVACAQLGRTFIGIERERKYFDIACERISRAQAQGSLIPLEQTPVAEQQAMDL